MYMRNYGGYQKQNSNDNIIAKQQQERGDKRYQLVLEENTIYEVDLDCMECMGERKADNKENN